MAGHFLHNADALCEPCVSMAKQKQSIPDEHDCHISANVS